MCVSWGESFYSFYKMIIKSSCQFAAVLSAVLN